MALLTVKNLNFHYDNEQILHDLSFSIQQGELVTIFGPTGSGKSTLLKLLKPEMQPAGSITGEISYRNELLKAGIMSQKIGYVLQNPHEQIVMESVWQELAFGLENVGISHAEMQQKIGEIASFFGIHKWLYKSTNALSGGQKQLLNLAAVLVMEPDILLLDEPTSQLDPIAAGEFIQLLHKINRELGITIVVIEHRLEELLSISDRILFLENGKLVHDSTPNRIGPLLKEHPMLQALPAATQIFCRLSQELQSPVTVREGMRFIERFTPQQMALNDKKERKVLLEARDISFRFSRKDEDVIANTSFQIEEGEIFSIVGGNGVGKSTLLSVLAGVRAAYKGKVLVDGKLLKNQQKRIVLLPQDPQSIFLAATVEEELVHMQKVDSKRVQAISEQMNITHLLQRNPFDVSGGEQQKVALAKLLLLQPDIILLDEPTKGMDGAFKKEFMKLLLKLQGQGVTIVIVTHDIDLAASVSNHCALFFDKQLIAINSPQQFFSRNRFYTTAACRIARNVFQYAITVEDVIACCKQQTNGGKQHEQYFSTSIK